MKRDEKSRKPVVLVLGTRADLDFLFDSDLAADFVLSRFPAAAEDGSERPPGGILRSLASALHLAGTILWRRVRIVHIDTSPDRGVHWGDFAHAMAAKACGASVVLQVHGAAPPQFLSRGPMLMATLRAPDAVVVLAKAAEDACRELVPGQYVIALPNAVDCGPLSGIARGQTRPDSPLHLLYAGPLAREKGLYETLQGLRLARMQEVDARLCVLGDGPEEAALKRFANGLGLGKSVHFAGPLSGEEKIERFREADVFILPSHSEDLPCALLESMAAGMPSIVTRVGAIPDVVSHGVHGLFVPPRDPKSISRAIAAFAEDRDSLRIMGEASRKRATANYSIERRVSEFARLYSEIIAARSLRRAARV